MCRVLYPTPKLEGGFSTRETRIWGEGVSNQETPKSQMLFTLKAPWNRNPYQISKYQNFFEILAKFPLENRLISRKAGGYPAFLTKIGVLPPIKVWWVHWTHHEKLQFSTAKLAVAWNPFLRRNCRVKLRLYLRRRKKWSVGDGRWAWGFKEIQAMLRDSQNLERWKGEVPFPSVPSLLYGKVEGSTRVVLPLPQWMMDTCPSIC